MSESKPPEHGSSRSEYPPDAVPGSERREPSGEAIVLEAAPPSSPPPHERTLSKTALNFVQYGAQVAGRYTVLEVLGQGGMGVVLAAYDARLDRRVALKLLLPNSSGSESGSGSLEARLMREAQAMARLNHPNVVALYDEGTLEDGRIFLAMEYVEGHTLRQWCKQAKRSWREVLNAFLAAGRGLEAAHAAGLVHRDFKPE